MHRLIKKMLTRTKQRLRPYVDHPGLMTEQEGQHLLHCAGEEYYWRKRAKQNPANKWAQGKHAEAKRALQAALDSAEDKYWNWRDSMLAFCLDRRCVPGEPWLV